MQTHKPDLAQGGCTDPAAAVAALRHKLATHNGA